MGRPTERRAIIRLARSTHPSMSYLAPPAQLPELLLPPGFPLTFPGVGMCEFPQTSCPESLHLPVGRS